MLNLVTIQGKITRRKAGPGVSGFSADGTNGTIQLGTPLGVAADASGSVYIADTSHNRVLRLSSTGSITTFAGTGAAGSAGQKKIGDIGAPDQQHETDRHQQKPQRRTNIAD